MKKTLSITIVVIMALSLFGCTKNDEPKEFSEVKFEYSDSKCSIIDDTNKELQPEFIASEKELADYCENTSKVCDLNTDGVSGSFNEKVKKYDNDFFSKSYLLLIKRYHTTAESLSINKISYKDGIFSVESSLKAGGESDNSFRIYAVEISRDYYIKNAKAELNVTEDKVSAVIDKSLMISKGENYYKIVPDEEIISKVMSLISKDNFTAKAISVDEYQIDDNDISVLYNGRTALLTEDFVILDEATYYPNNEIKNKLSDIYKEISYESMTFEAILNE